MESQDIIYELKTELEIYKSIEQILGKSFEWPLKSTIDGYPEFAIDWLYEVNLKILCILFKFHGIPLLIIIPFYFKQIKL